MLLGEALIKYSSPPDYVQAAKHLERILDDKDPLSINNRYESLLCRTISDLLMY